MSQSSEDNKAEAAEERTEQTRTFVRRVRAATLRRYTAEEKIRFVLEGFRHDVTVNGLVSAVRDLLGGTISRFSP